MNNIFSILLIVFVSSSLFASQNSKGVKSQEYCPVMSKNKINKKLYVEHDGKKIYVCCNECIAEVNKNPEKYIKQLEDNGVVLDKVANVQEYCPVMPKNKINKKLYVDVDGKRVYVCCKMCLSKVKSKPGKYIKQLEDDGISLEDVE